MNREHHLANPGKPNDLSDEDLEKVSGGAEETSQQSHFSQLAAET